MRRALLAGLLTIGLVLSGASATAAPPEPPPPQERGPACADIVGFGSFFERARSGRGQLRAIVELAGPSCPGITYTVHVLEGDGPDALPIASRSVGGARSDLVTFENIEIALEDAGSIVCAYASSSAGNRVFDRVPTEGCFISFGGLPCGGAIAQIGGRYQLGEEGDPGVFLPELFLTDASCHGTTYAIHVLDSDAEGAALLASRAIAPAGPEGFTWLPFDPVDIVVGDGDPAICVYATAHDGEVLFDRSPDEGCKVFQPASCADIDKVGGSYEPAEVIGDPGLYSPWVGVAGPSCPHVTYTVYVLDSQEPGAPLLASQSVQGDGTVFPQFADMAVVVQDGDPKICVYVTSSSGEGVLDRIPAVGCVRPDLVRIGDFWWFP